ncbi:winged helix-turn-helix transcriptional regulator [Adonisia turfae]
MKRISLSTHWTLIILRDMLNGKNRFSEFLDSPERITTNVLTDRLVLMEETGLVNKIPYQLRPKRFEYELTEKGLGLLHLLQEMCRWANHFMSETWTALSSFMNRKI